jgi:hypothetical protein
MMTPKIAAMTLVVLSRRASGTQWLAGSYVPSPLMIMLMDSIVMLR